MPAKSSAEQFVEQLTSLLPPEKRQDYRDALEPGHDDIEMGVPMGKVFALAKEFVEMPPGAMPSSTSMRSRRLIS